MNGDTVQLCSTNVSVWTVLGTNSTYFSFIAHFTSAAVAMILRISLRAKFGILGIETGG